MTKGPPKDTTVAAKQEDGIPSSTITRTINQIGDRWTLLILQEMFLGANRFRDWQKSINIARSTLVNRLQRLIDSKCIIKVPGHGVSKHPRYELTKRGRELYPVFLSIWRWEMRWYMDRDNPPVVLEHELCGNATEPELGCGHCHEVVGPRDISYMPGPGAGRDPRQPRRHHRRSIVEFKYRRGRTAFVKAAEILGDHWTHLVIGAPFQGFRRFDEIQKELKISTNILTNRLNRLVDDGLLTKRLYQKRPNRYEYFLTEKGLDIYAMNVAMMKWGDRWLSGPKGPPMLLFHKKPNHRFDPVMICSHCKAELNYDEVHCTDTA